MVYEGCHDPTDLSSKMVALDSARSEWGVGRHYWVASNLDDDVAALGVNEAATRIRPLDYASEGTSSVVGPDGLHVWQFIVDLDRACDRGGSAPERA